VLQALGDPASGVDELVVMIDPTEHRRVMELASSAAPRLGCRCAEGGARRQESVERGLRLCSREMVLVHDGARPGVTAELCARVLRAARELGGATACLPVSDSTARLLDGRLGEILPRSELTAIQTPQAFRREILQRAHREAVQVGRDADDDAALVLAMGEPVAAVLGDPRNLKITRTEDLLALRAWLSSSVWARQ
jgi:2-C-methyl-D-erythritol 4-phosphate cytidylyltransferase